MTDFTVETVMAPVVNDDWSTLRSMTDVVPGTLLLEDSQEPTLIFPVEADTLSQAAALVQGVASVAGLSIKWGRAYRTEFDGPEADATETAGDHVPTVVPGFLPDWLESSSRTQSKRAMLTTC